MRVRVCALSSLFFLPRAPCRSVSRCSSLHYLSQQNSDQVGKVHLKHAVFRLGKLDVPYWASIFFILPGW